MKKSARSYALTLTLVCVALTLAPLGGAESQPLAVEGKNDPAVDVQAVQKAVDQGGTVLLKGRFDFGDKGSVTITEDVNVLGETDERGAPRTTIRGGYYAFTVPLRLRLSRHQARRSRSRISISMGRCGVPSGWPMRAA